jgi:DnaJ-class molecular chaperone
MASKTYYEILGVKEDASFQELASRFRILAVTHHPLKNPSQLAEANFKFSQVCEAFEVLSKRKCIF